MPVKQSKELATPPSGPLPADPELANWEEPVERLVQALQRDEFELFAQPIVALDRPASVPMAEVLIRMREEEERLLPPGAFLPVFESRGMMPDLDRWVMRHAIARLARGSRVPCLSLNISVQTLGDAEFLLHMSTELSRHRVPASSIALEVGEEDILARPTSIDQFASAARRMGCRLTIDGFGRTNVSLAPLQALRPNYVKLDRSIVRQLDKSQLARDKLSTLVQIGKKVGIGVIGECVESEEVLARLRLGGAGFAQGYGIRMPAPIEVVTGR
jgi:EAL domain-containing protein (putative c-di-GMP-specific phosphodiesterase class I)